MTKEFKIMVSGFADEISNDLETQARSIRSLGLKHLSLRSIGDRNIGDFSVLELEEQILPVLDRFSVKVSSIGSPIGKIFINDHEGFARQLEMADRLGQMARILECRYIRIFSFYMPRGENPSKWRSQVIDWTQQIIARFEATGIVGLHENEKDIYGDTATRCKDLFDTINNTHFRGVFDFANFVQCGEKPETCYELLNPYIEYFHIKDAVSASQENVLCGTGEGQIREILGQALLGGYEGFLTLEPHLAEFAALKTLELDGKNQVDRKKRIMDGFQGFSLQYQALQRIIREISQSR